MSSTRLLPPEEQQEVEDLLLAFVDHGCGLGLDFRATKVIQQLLAALDRAEEDNRRLRAELEHARRR